MTRPTYGSLFSGVGGMDMGFDTYMDCVFQVEWDKHAQSILRRHWPDVPKWGDVQEVNGADLPPCDVLTFGSPCQDLSVAGKRAGLDGGRSSMFYEAVRIIKEMRDATSSRPTGPLPRIAVWENVPGALSSNKGADFKSVIDEMVDLGACLVEWAVLDAQHFGVPQRRRRVFLVAIFDPATAERCPNPLLPVSEGRRGDFAKGRKKGQDVAGSVATSVDAGSTHRQLGHGHYVEDDTASALKQRDYKDATDLIATPVVANQVIGALCARDYKGVGNQYVTDNKLVVQDAFVKARRAQNDTDDETWVEGEVTPTLNAFDNGGESRATVLMPIIFDGTRHDDFRMDTEIVPTLKQRMGTGGGQVPMVAEPVAYNIFGGNKRADRPEGGFYATETQETKTLDSATGLNPTANQGGVAIVEPVAASFKPGASAKAYGIGYEEETAPTLESGGGGNNKPAIIQPVTVFQPGAMIRLGGGVSDDIVPTLRAEAKRGDNEPHIAQPYSFDTQFGSNANVFTDLSPTLKASQQSPSVTTSLAVRRLTPLECERLMGYNDFHTRWTDEGKEQADTHRYKQCGNGVAAPVARWIAGHLTRILG